MEGDRYLENPNSFELSVDAIPDDNTLDSSLDESLDDTDLVDQVHQRVLRKNRVTILEWREEYIGLEDQKIKELLVSIELLKQEINDRLEEIEEIRKGSRDDTIVKRETERKVNQFIVEYL